MTQAFLLTTTHHVLAFDGEERFFKIHSGKGLYYGLARNGKYVYVSCRNQASTEPEQWDRTAENGSILVIDAGSLQLVGELRPESFPIRDVHGIAYFDRKLWVTSSHDNLVAIFDPTLNTWSKWYPSPDETARDRDVNHFNTIVPDGRHISVVAHNHGPSHVMRHDRLSLKFQSRLELGRQAHDVFRARGGIGTCSSGDGILVSDTGWAIRTGGFPRGIAATDDDIFVGISQCSPRALRHETSGILRRFTPDWEYASDSVLPGVGMVLAIMPCQIDSGLLGSFEPIQSQTYCGQYNPVEPGNVYSAGSSRVPVFDSEWHGSEGSHRWTAALLSRMSIVVNPGETSVSISADSGFPGPYWAEVLLNDRLLGSMHWSAPGECSQRFALPSELEGRCELSFRIPQLWRPAACLGTEDERLLGLGVKHVTIRPGHATSHQQRIPAAQLQTASAAC